MCITLVREMKYKKVNEFLVNSLFAARIWNYRIRTLFYNSYGMKIGKSSAIHSGCFFSGKNFEMGNGSYLNRNCLIDCAHGKVSIGNNVGIAFDVSIYTTQHDYGNPEKRTGAVRGDDVIIGDGVWIGGGATICPGVHIGNGCVIAAGSVVVGDCEPNCIYGGNPARLIKKLEENTSYV